MSQFKEIFERIGQIGSLKILQIDLSDSKLTVENVGVIVNCLKRLNLNHFHINLNNVEFSESLLDMMLRPLYGMEGLRKLHFALENINMNKEKQTIIQECFEKLPKLTSARLNIKNNKNVSEEDISNFRNVLSNYDENYLINE
jgi:hypothetical protein